MGPEEVARAEADVRSFEAAAALVRQEWEREQELFDREISARATADAAQGSAPAGRGATRGRTPRAGPRAHWQ